MEQQSECVFVSECTQARVRRCPSSDMCASLTSMHAPHEYVCRTPWFSSTHMIFVPVCASVCVRLQHWKVCIISLLATSKWRTTEFCSFCSSAGLLGDGWTGWHHQNASQACGRSLFWHFIYIQMLFFLQPPPFSCRTWRSPYIYFPPSWIERRRFLFRIQSKESSDFIHKSSDALKELSEFTIIVCFPR